MDSQIKCPIWGTSAKVLQTIIPGGRRINSPRTGGAYDIQDEVAEDLPQHIRRGDHERLTQRIVNCRNRDSVFEFDSIEYLEKVIRNDPLWGITDRADNLLRLLVRNTGRIGFELRCNLNKADNEDLDWLAASGSKSEEEIRFLADFLGDQGFIKIPKKPKEHAIGYIVLAAGYAHVEQSKYNLGSDQVFVAMWFDDSMNDIYDNGFKPAIESCGYTPLPINRKQHNNKIDDEIISEIRRSRFMVADFTCATHKTLSGDSEGPTDENMVQEHRGGVYFEAGFAHGLGMDVIWTCREDLIDGIHFDTRQYNHILWKDAADLQIQLRDRILATIVEGPRH